MNILFSANIATNHQERLKANFPEQSFIFSGTISEAEAHLAIADIIVTYGEDLTAEHIKQANRLKWIMVISAGMEKMPFKAIEQRGILVTNSRGIHKVPMAEYAISMLLQVYRQEKLLIQNESINKWDKSLRMQEISGQTMLIVGTGAIGQEVARLGKAFHMTTYGVSKSGKSVRFFDEIRTIDVLDDLLPMADFIISVLPSTAETRGIFTTKQFKQMASHAIFLNMGRGDAVNDDELIEAVKQNEIAHAVLDVFDEEPLHEDHPFWQNKNITVTPHLSGVSSHYLSRALAIFEKNLRTYVEGETVYLNQVDATKGY